MAKKLRKNFAKIRTKLREEFFSHFFWPQMVVSRCQSPGGLHCLAQLVQSPGVVVTAAGSPWTARQSRQSSPGPPDGPMRRHITSGFDDDDANSFRRREIFRFFVRPFTPPGWLRSVRNFGKTRFRRFPTFDFSTSKIFF